MYGKIYVFNIQYAKEDNLSQHIDVIIVSISRNSLLNINNIENSLPQSINTNIVYASLIIKRRNVNA